jgi:hypothetical protein
MAALLEDKVKSAEIPPLRMLLVHSEVRPTPTSRRFCLTQKTRHSNTTC